MRKAKVFYNPEHEYPNNVQIHVLESGGGIGYAYAGEGKFFKQRFEAFEWAVQNADIVWDMEAIKNEN